MAGTPKPATGPQLVVGLVGPTGTDLDEVCRKLGDSLARVDYKTSVISLSGLLLEVPKAPWLPLPQKPEDERIAKYQDAGRQLCSDTGRGDAMAALGITKIQAIRDDLAPSGNAAKAAHIRHGRRAYILKSLKRPAEVEALRLIYGTWFFLIGAARDHETRLDRLSSHMRDGHPRDPAKELEKKAERLLDIDRNEAATVAYGQDVSSTFAMCDAFLDTSSSDKMAVSSTRLVELIFGNRLRTPTRSEYAMSVAFTSGLRSADLSRQVGAAVVHRSGRILSTGSNEVPRAGGGQYWEGDPHAARDHERPGGRNPSDERRDSLLADVLTILEQEHLLSDAFGRKVKDDLPASLLDAWDGGLKRSKLRDVIEFQRAVHAEMAALMDASLRGVSVKGAHLYCTTFPCHLCAKHIIDAGIARVYYIEPYPKSLADEFYPDSIELNRVPAPDEEDFTDNKVLFLPLVGVSPRRYVELFSLAKGERADNQGRVKVWEDSKETSLPTLGQPRSSEVPANSVLVSEQTIVKQINSAIHKAYP